MESEESDINSTPNQPVPVNHTLKITPVTMHRFQFYANNERTDSENLSMLLDFFNAADAPHEHKSPSLANEQNDSETSSQLGQISLARLAGGDEAEENNGSLGQRAQVGASE